MNQLSNRLVNCINSSIDFLESIQEDTTRSHVKGKWSQQEIIGHLIDSAINNYRRFVIGKTTSTLIFDGYKQDLWVKAQKYNDLGWMDLLNYWKSLNLLLAKLIENISEEVLMKQYDQHNLHLIGFAKFSKEESYSLRDFIADYIDHIDHHINQIKITAGIPKSY